VDRPSLVLRDYALANTNFIQSPADPPSMTTGLADFITTVDEYAHHVPRGPRGTAAFMLRIGDDFAFIRLRDIWRPMRFLRQMAGAPPVRFGTVGFDPALVDDRNPARHYTAFVVAGFWLSAPLALALLLGWEVLGFVRYSGLWSNQDLRCGLIGLRHGRRVRQFGPLVLPGLIARDLAAGEK
jgi:hypothetical protein